MRTRVVEELKKNSMPADCMSELIESLCYQLVGSNRKAGVFTSFVCIRGMFYFR